MAYTSRELPKVCEVDKQTPIQPPVFCCVRCNKSMCEACWRVHFPCRLTEVLEKM